MGDLAAIEAAIYDQSFERWTNKRAFSKDFDRAPGHLRVSQRSRQDSSADWRRHPRSRP